jgi:hypothetical protein
MGWRTLDDRHAVGGCVCDDLVDEYSVVGIRFDLGSGTTP